MKANYFRLFAATLLTAALIISGCNNSASSKQASADQTAKGGRDTSSSIGNSAGAKFECNINGQKWTSNGDAAMVTRDPTSQSRLLMMLTFDNANDESIALHYDMETGQLVSVMYIARVMEHHGEITEIALTCSKNTRQRGVEFTSSGELTSREKTIENGGLVSGSFECRVVVGSTFKATPDSAVPAEYYLVGNFEKIEFDDWINR